jgi:alpha-glucosidase
VGGKRGRDEWFLGAITDEEARTLEVPLTFLPAGRRYVAEIYADTERSHWLTAPLEYQILEQPVDASTRPTLRLAPGGGVAVRIRPAQ